MKDDLDTRVQTLVAYIKTLEDFQLHDAMGTYEHMGATITDAVLQAGISYESVVRPRVERMKREYPTASTTSTFLQLLQSSSPEEILSFRGRKPQLALTLTQFFKTENIETEADLQVWLQDNENVKKLKSISGIGSKTADYLKILVGLQTVAIDSRLLGFLANADITTKGYKDAHRLISATADSMGVSQAVLDHSIWRYMDVANR